MLSQGRNAMVLWVWTGRLLVAYSYLPLRFTGHFSMWTWDLG